MQLPLFKPSSAWTPPALSTLPAWRGAKRVGLDIETCDPHLKELGPGPRRNGFITGISFAIEDGPAAYLPVQHVEDNLPREASFAYIQEQLKGFSGEIVGANLSYDLDFLLHAGFKFSPTTVFRDIQLAAPLINELEESFSLDNIAKRLGLKGKDEEQLRVAAEAYGVNPKSEMYKLPARFVADYAVQDVRLPLAVLRLQEKQLAEQGLGSIFDLESRCLPVLAAMRQRGVAISEKKLDEVEAWARAQEKEALATVKHLTGIEVPLGAIMNAKILETVLNKLGYTVGRTKTGKPNIDASVLGALDHPAADALAWARKVNKLRTTFGASIRDHWAKGRIHCVFNQMARAGDDDLGVKGARYGRLSSEHPNLQQQPARDEFAKFWRSIYVPDEGGLWASCDYSQQEPRLTTHYAVKAKCTRAVAAADKYRNDPKADNHQVMADLTGLPRKQAKNIYLGLCYGMGGAKLAKSLELPTQIITNYKGRRMEVAGEEAQKILDKFNAEAPFVGELAKKCQELAERRGYITTLLGRRCHFPRDAAGNFDWCHKSLNRLIQGSAADQTKAAMVAADAAGFKLQLQVHDELDLTVNSREEAERLGEIMKNCVTLEVPSRVDVEVGPSWGEAT